MKPKPFSDLSPLFLTKWKFVEPCSDFFRLGLNRVDTSGHTATIKDGNYSCWVGNTYRTWKPEVFLSPDGGSNTGIYGYNLRMISKVFFMFLVSSG